MKKLKHTPQQRAEILKRLSSGEQSIREIAEEQGVTIKTLQNWKRASKSSTGSFIEVPTISPRATVVELSFADGTILRIRG
jgi:transposase-like protein